MGRENDQDDGTRAAGPEPDTRLGVEGSGAGPRSSRPPLLSSIPESGARRNWFGVRTDLPSLEELVHAVRELDQQLLALEQSGLQRADRIEALEGKLTTVTRRTTERHLKDTDGLEARLAALESRPPPGRDAALPSGAPENRLHALELELAEERLRRRDLELRLGRLQLAVEGAAPSKEAGNKAPGPTSPEVSKAMDTTRVTAIDGIGSVFAKKLAGEGVEKASQLADWNEADIARYARILGISPARVRRERWVEQARELLNR